MRFVMPFSPLGALIAAMLLVTSADAADLSAFPTKPICMVVRQEPDSALDNSLRVFTPGLGEALGQQIVIDNRPGVGGMIAMQIGLASVPDGYSIINAGSPQMIASFLFKILSDDLFRGFVPIG